MSNEDRTKWDERYAQGAYLGRPAPSAWLTRWLPRAPAGSALDVACGLGRNARYMARRGYRVDAVDISAQALARAASLADAQALRVRWLEHDLDRGLPVEVGQYQLIALFRYVNAPLLTELVEHLAPGGYLVAEQHLITQDAVAGPRNRAFRVGPGELSAALAGLRVLANEESVFADPDGERVALARIAAMREP